MKATVARASLITGVPWAAQALPARPTSPQLTCLLLEAGNGLTLSGFDYEVSARAAVEAEIGEPGTALVPGRLLAEIIHNLPDKPASLESDGTRLILRCCGAVFTLALIPAGDYPALPGLPPLAGTAGADALAGAVSQVAIAAGKDDTLPALTGIRIEVNGETLTLAATDRYRLAVRTLPWIPAQPTAAGPVIIPAQVLLRATRALTTAAEASIFLPGAEPGPPGSGIAGFSAGDRQITMRLLSGKFPDYEKLIPAEFLSAAEVPVVPFTEAIKRVALVAERDDPIRLRFDGGEVTLTAGSANQAEATEVLDEISFDGPAGFQIAFNPHYLLDGLGALGTDTARISFTGDAKPTVLTGTAQTPMRRTHALGPQPGYRYALMPIRGIT